MKKYIHTTQIALVALFLLFLSVVVPASASAATVYLEASRNTVSVGDTAIVTVKINADGAVLNTVDGEVVLRGSGAGGNLVVQEFSLANSSFGLWPRTPSLSTDGRRIAFVGGVPGGFSIEGATLFKIIVDAKKEGVMTISPENISVFANDGKGTKVPVNVKGVSINVVARKDGIAVNNEWQGLVSADTKAPEDFLIVLGQDPTLFQGKKFAFFSALDNQSGIDYYSVSEDGAPEVRSGSMYVLRNQSDDAKLVVVAHDKAGNKKTAKYPTSRPISWLSILVVVLIAVIAKIVYKRWRKNKKNAEPAY